MATTIEQQVALDEALVPSTQRLRIGRSNFRLPSDIQSKESTLQVVYDVLRSCPFFKEILEFFRFLGHSAQIRTLTDVNINKLHQPWRSFGAVINKCLTRKSSGFDSFRLSQAQIFAITTPTTAGAITPRLTAAAKGKQPAKAKSASDPSELARTKAQQLKIVLRRSRKESHISQLGASGTDEGIGSKPGVPDLPSDDSEEEISWNSSDDEDLEAKVLTRSSHSSRTSYAVAADLSEMELKKILIEKMEGNKSIQCSDEQRNLYKALVEAYEANKIILDTYGERVILKIRRDDDDDQGEGPSAGSDRGSKRQRERKEPESASASLEPATRSAVRVDTLTPELLAGPTYELMKGSCNSLIELEYHLEEVYKATMNQLDWVNPEGQQYPHNLLQPLLLIPNNRGRRVIPFVHFINNDLEYLQGGDFKRLRLQDIEDMLLLLVQGKLSNLTVEERFAFNVSLRMFTRSIVIQRCVEDL
nr:hypothetical protein [Tanacetum cinerariifolium]